LTLNYFYWRLNIVNIDEIPDELIWNFDQTALNCVPVTPWTMEEEGAKRVEILAKDDNSSVLRLNDFFSLHLIRLISVYLNTIFHQHGMSHIQTITGQMK